MHYLVDHLQMKFQCQVCNEAFKDFNALAAHKLVRHQENEVGFDCHICKQTFVESDILVQHLLKNHLGIQEPKIPMKDQQQHQCNHCGKNFNKKSNLTSHILTVFFLSSLISIQNTLFLSKNSILTKPQHFHEFFTQFFFDNFSRELKIVNS